MKNTKTTLDTYDLDGRIHCVMEFDLVKEDFDLAFSSMTYMNNAIGVDDDLADHFLALLTYGLHRATEERTGKPFVLRMDRRKN